MREPLLKLLRSLQGRYGYAYASERGLRAMLHEDEAALCGVSTIPKFLRREELRGTLQARWIRAGSVLPDGRVAAHGTMRIRVAVSRAERETIRRAAGEIDHAEGVDGSPVTFASWLKLVTGRVRTVVGAAKERERDEARAACSAAVEQWAAEHPYPGRES